VPESIMPRYDFLARTGLKTWDLPAKMKTLRTVGVPYTQDDIDNALVDVQAQTMPDEDPSDLQKRYGAKVVPQDYGSHDPGGPTEMDALIAYLQQLGTQVDFTAYDPDYELHKTTAKGGAK